MNCVSHGWWAVSIQASDVGGAAVFQLAPVAWPQDYPAFTLQTATNLNPPVNWLNATDSPMLLNGQFTVTNSLSGAKFY